MNPYMLRLGLTPEDGQTLRHRVLRGGSAFSSHL